MRGLLRHRKLLDAAPALDAASDDTRLAVASVRNPAAFAHLFNRYWDLMLKFCYSRTGDWHRAEDAASEVFVQALASIDRFDPSLPDTSFRAWLFGIARNVLSVSQRSASKYAGSPLDLAFGAPDTNASVEEIILATERHEELRRLLDALPIDQREHLELRISGLTAVEIATLLGQTPASIRKSQSRAVISMRDALASSSVEKDGIRNG